MSVVPIGQFMDADFFLLLRSVCVHQKQSIGYWWRPWSSLYMEGRVPRFIAEATNAANAQRLLPALGADGIVVLQEAIRQAVSAMNEQFGTRHPRLEPFCDFDLSKIGTQ